MNKYLLLVVATIAFGLGLSNIEAGYRRCYSGPCEKTCAPCENKQVCGSPCAVSRVIEDPCCAPCCVRYVKVEEQPIITKHISYSYECPSGCTPEQKQLAGTIQAGQTAYSSANY